MSPVDNFLSTADSSRWWYSPILPLEPSFPSTCLQTLTTFLLAVSLHLSRKRPADAFLDFLTHSSSIIIVFFNELSEALMNQSRINIEPSNALYKYLEVNPDSNLANVLDVEQQRRKLQAVSEDILRTFLDSDSYNCRPVKIFLREVLAGLILEKSVQTCSKPEWINGWIVYLLEESETGILDALDAGVDDAATNGINGDLSKQTQLNGSVQRGEISDASQISKSPNHHHRTVSRAESAMEEAMLEAKRLSELIAAEEAKRRQENSDSTLSENVIADEVSKLPPRSDLDSLAKVLPIKPNDEENGERKPTTADIQETLSNFTSFDQIISSQKPNTAQSNISEPQLIPVPALTLHNASVSIFDDAQPGDKASIRSKPTIEYLLQIEPVLSQYPGWMIARKYADFETLHEVLRRISVVSGVPMFAQKYNSLPTWKNRTKNLLRGDLEKYLRDALSFNRLAESEGMKRFLEKDQGMDRASAGKSRGGFSFPSPAAFETMGKGMLDVLASAPKGAAGGGKAILGGVTGVLGGVGSLGQRKQGSASNHNISRVDSHESGKAASHSRDSEDLGRNSFAASESRKLPGLSSRSSLSLPETPEGSELSLSGQILDSGLGQQSLTEIPKSDVFESSNHQPKSGRENLDAAQSELHLPPPPSEIPDDYKISQDSSRVSISHDESAVFQPSASTTSTALQSPRYQRSSSPLTAEPKPASPILSNRKNSPPLTEKETQVAIELFFAVINELYTLSSAWNIRRTLLNAAKSFLLRPGNPNLEAIRLLLQDTIIDANTSDTGIAAHLTKIRQNALPTEDELKNWPTTPPSDEEKEKLRVKARRLLVEKGMPQALTSVMGAAASGKALGRVFDCLQVEEVARGLVFALLLQAIRGITQ